MVLARALRVLCGDYNTASRATWGLRPTTSACSTVADHPRTLEAVITFAISLLAADRRSGEGLRDPRHLYEHHGTVRRVPHRSLPRRSAEPPSSGPALETEDALLRSRTRPGYYRYIYVLHHPYYTACLPRQHSPPHPGARRPARAAGDNDEAFAGLKPSFGPDHHSPLTVAHDWASDLADLGSRGAARALGEEPARLRDSAGRAHRVPSAARPPDPGLGSLRSDADADSDVRRHDQELQAGS